MKIRFKKQLIDILAKLGSTIDISTKAECNKTFKRVLKLGEDLLGYNFIFDMRDSKITDATQFQELLLSDEFNQFMMDDRLGVNVVKKIKRPNKTKIAAEMKEIYNKYKHNMSTDIDDVDDPLHTYAIRTDDGSGEVVFVDGIKTDEGRREVRRWYAWTYKINYFKVRECSIEHWLKHPETQTATRQEKYNDNDLYDYEDKMAKEDRVMESANECKYITREQIMNLLQMTNKNYKYPYLVKFEDRGNMWGIYYDDKHVININKSCFDEEYLYEIGWLEDENAEYSFEDINADEMDEAFDYNNDRDFRTSRKMKHDRQNKLEKRNKKFKRIDNIDYNNILDDEFDDEFEYNLR